MIGTAISRTATLLEAIKFAHSVFALPFALLGAFIASAGLPNPGKLLLIVLCMVLVRNVAMSYNRLADQHLDKTNPRTATRALPAGRLSPRFLWTFLAASAAGATAAAFLFYYLYHNPWPLALIGPLLVWIAAYSHTKRFTWLSHYWLGSVLGISVPAAAVAIDPSRLSPAVILLGLGVALWTAGFDIIYALLDLEFDRRQRLYSVPARFGPSAGLIVARITHAAAFACFLAAGLLLGLNRFYPLGLIVAAALLILQHRLVRPDDLSRVNVAFFTLNGILSILLSGMGILDLLTR
ncbi:MAG: UbiA family prenyltransferase [Phycisphaerae bacterium]|nr:UbiA family prenyltransferase [Phycisphaerae bacterium]